MMDYPVRAIGLLTICVIDTSLGGGQTKWEKLNNILDENDFSTPPWRAKRGKSTVTMEIFFSQIRRTEVNKVEFMFNLYQTWSDTRLSFDSKSSNDIVEISRRHWDKVWQPDLYPDSDLSSNRPDVSKVNKLMWVLPNGTVTLGLRWTTEFSCRLQTVQFPVGKLNCKIKFRTFSYRNEILKLQWKKKNAIHFAPSSFENDLKIAKYRGKSCTQDKVSLVRTSCAEVGLTLKMDYSSSLLRLYLPSVFVVIMAWLSFWVRRDYVAARTSLTTLCVVSMITEKMGVNFLMPEAVGVMAVEVWMFVCLSFVCSALFEFICVHTLTELERKSKVSGNSNVTKADAPSDEEVPHFNKTTNASVSVVRTPLRRCGTFLKSGQLETCAKIIYAIGFVSFQITYWAYFLLFN